MKRNLLLVLMIMLLTPGVKATAAGANMTAFQASTAITDGFITTWKISNPGGSITIPIDFAYASIYNYLVDWGDGVVGSFVGADATHSYAAAGTYTVKITGEFPAIKFGGGADYGNELKILTVEQWGNGTWKGMDVAFSGCANLTTVPGTTGPKFAPNATLYAMFFGCSSLDCDLNGWDLTNVREISQMFHGASAFNGDISDWDVSNVTNMENLFENATIFNGDLSSWDVSKVTRMNNMFDGAYAFNGDISSWNVGAVQNMKQMFATAFAFNQDISGWDVKNVKIMQSMFQNANDFNQNLNQWNVESVVNMRNMFAFAKSFNPSCALTF